MDLIGTSIGNIEIIERLGEGGMGEVYLGFDRVLERRVAVKAIRAERRTDDRARVRMLREARVLSRLDHPHICRVHELIQEEATDYLVLELVEGRRLREVLQDDLSLAQRLDLASQLAAALVAAHAVSVVHRDLKPENIMVTAERQVKVLDFGLARLFEDAASESAGVGLAGRELEGPFSEASPSATVTELGEVLGTPRYMSPEQARGESATAASDVYSFGLILQELLTGRPPFDVGLSLRELLVKASWGDREPVCGVPPSLAALIDELCEIEPERRPSAQAAAERLRWIVDTPRRRMRRLAAAAVMVALAAFSVVSTIGFVAARRAQARAERSETETRAVNSFLRDMLASADPREQGMDVKVVDVLDRAAEHVNADFAEHPLVRAEVLDTLGFTYYAVGKHDAGCEHLKQALEIRSAELGRAAPETLGTMHRLGLVLADSGHEKEGEELLREVVDQRTAALGAENPDTLESLDALGRTLRLQREYTDAVAIARQVLEIRRSTLGDRDPLTFTAMISLAKALVHLEEFDECLALLNECADGRADVLGPKHPDVIDVIHQLGVTYARSGRFPEAESAFLRVVELQTEVLGPEHPVTLQCRLSLASVLNAMARGAEAEEMLRPLAADFERTVGAAHRHTIFALFELSRSLQLQGRESEALEVMHKRWKVAEKELGPDHRITLENMSGYAAALLRVEPARVAEVETLYRSVLEARLQVFGPDAWATLRSKRDLAKTLDLQDRADEAEQLREEYEAGMVKLGYASK